MKDRANEVQEYAAPQGGAWRRLLGLAALVAAACAAGGCSLTVPMGGVSGDDVVTGTIKNANPSPFSSEMDAEDWRRAKSALDTALDPQGNGASVAWGNPDSGAKGSFVPLAQVYPKGDGICRAFAAHLELKGQPDRLLHSSACRTNSGGWVVGQVTPAKSDRASVGGKSDNLAERDTGTQLR